MNALEEQFSQQQRSPAATDGMQPLPSADDGTQPPAAVAGGTQRNATAAGGTEPLPSDGFRARPPMAARIRTADHTLTTLEVVEMLRNAGVPRSVRRVTEYCERGDLDAFRDPDERRWYVTPASVNDLIGYFQQLQARHVATADDRAVPPPSATHGTPPPASAESGSQRKPAAEHDPPLDTGSAPAHVAERLKKMEDELMGLKISNQAKDMVIGQLKEERTGFIELLQKRAYMIGKLKARLLQLRAPESSEQRAGKPAHHIPPAAPQTHASAEPSPVNRQTFVDIRESDIENRV